MSTAHRGPYKNCPRKPVARLDKAHVEALLADYDAAPIESLTIALQVALDLPTLDWAALLDLADLPDERRQQLLRGDPVALDELAAELNEVREVAVRTPPCRQVGDDDFAPPSGTQAR